MTARPGRPPRGAALVAVMWMVAALTLLVGGILGVSRAELRGAQTFTSAATAAAVGDAAIQLAALEWTVAPPDVPALTRKAYEFDGWQVAVRIVPANGYVDLNGAPEPLLIDLFRYGAGLDDAAAEMFAQRIIDWRDPDDGASPRGAEAEAYAAAGVGFRPRNGRFAAVEDLMQVLGMELDLFDRIRPFVTVWAGSGARGVDPMAAPPEVLAILAGGDASRVAAIAGARDAGDLSADTTALEQAHLARGRTTTLHVEAAIPDGDGRLAVRGRWISLERSPDGAPWKTVATEAVRFVPGAGN